MKLLFTTSQQNIVHLNEQCFVIFLVFRKLVTKLLLFFFKFHFCYEFFHEIFEVSKKNPDILVDVKFFKNKFGCIDWKILKRKGLNLTSWLKQRFFTIKKCSFFHFYAFKFCQSFLVPLF